MGLGLDGGMLVQWTTLKKLLGDGNLTIEGPSRNLRSWKSFPVAVGLFIICFIPMCR